MLPCPVVKSIYKVKVSAEGVMFLNSTNILFFLVKKNEVTHYTSRETEWHLSSIFSFVFRNHKVSSIGCFHSDKWRRLLTTKDRQRYTNEQAFGTEENLEWWDILIMEWKRFLTSDDDENSKDYERHHVFKAWAGIWFSCRAHWVDF